MSFLKKITGVFHKLLHYRIYFGKNIKCIPPGALMLFPIQDSRCNCGLTGIVAFRKEETPTSDLPFPEMESLILSIKEYTYKKIRSKQADLTDTYLGGERVLKELQGLVGSLKRTSSLYTMFQNASAMEKVTAVSRTVEKIIHGEEHEYHKRLQHFSLEESELITRRINLLKDICWSLQKEIVRNIEKIADLSASNHRNISFPAFTRLKSINTLLNNVDRLEVRGRDSAGISLISMVEKKDYQQFENALQEKLLLDEHGDRQKEISLLNRTISVSRNANSTTIVFTYKIAAEIGHLGDNTAFLRKQIQDDRIFQLFLAVPLKYQTMVAHTRWASVGEISEPNCHPVDNIVNHQGTANGSSDAPRIIHACLNGDIDNYVMLKEAYERKTKRSIPQEITTDTKIIPLQIQKYYNQGHPIEESFRLAARDFTGSHAIAMHTDIAPGKIFLALRGSGQSIFVGLGDECYLPASEVYGLVEDTSRYIKMEGEKKEHEQNSKHQGQILMLDQDSFGGLTGMRAMYYDGSPIQLTTDDIKHTEITSRDIDRRDFPHYFFKEIYESPESVEKTLQNKWAISSKRQGPGILETDGIPPSLEKALQQHSIRNILFVGQGTAGVAACGCAKLLQYYLARSGINVAPCKASEFSGGISDTDLKDFLVVAITQSGTTTDTNTAMVMAGQRGAHTMAIVNRRDSDITFKVDGVLYTSTGRDIEMSVASTKAYYAQITAGGILGLKFAQLTNMRDNDFIFGELERLMKLPSLMKKVLSLKEEIERSARTFAPTKKYWAVVGSGYNKIAADEIRIKWSELCYKTISSDVVEDKKHIDLSSEPLILVCAAGNRGDVINDIIKDTAIFKAHQATTIVIAAEGEERFAPYADSLFYVPEIEERFAPIITTLAGHLWGYYAAKAIHEESRFLFDFRQEISSYISASMEKGLDIYQTILEKVFQEKTVKFFSFFKKRMEQRRYATAMELDAASDLTLLLKYLSGRLPVSDFELDFGVSGTAPNIFDIFFRTIGKAINDMARPIDAIRHQAKTVTVGTSRIWKPIEGLLFAALKNHDFDESNITNKNVLVLSNLQEIIAEIRGETLYAIGNLTYTGEPVEDSMINVAKTSGTSAQLVSRVHKDQRLKGTKRIIVKAGNVFIGKGKIDNRSILVIPIMKKGPNIDHLLLLDVAFKEKIDLSKKVKALGEKFHHIKNIVEETDLLWDDRYLNALAMEDLFGNSAEKIAEFIISSSAGLS